MDTQRWLERLGALWDGDLHHADHPRDRRFQTILDRVPSMATENKFALLNHSAACLEPGERYLEIGAWLGASIIAASLDHPTSRFVTIDDFSQFGGTAAACRWNLAAANARNVTLVDGDCFEFLATTDDLAPVGVCFYDGAHTFDAQVRAFDAVERHLADEALVVIDDTGFPEVAAANRHVVARHPGFDLVLRVDSPYNTEPRWWNGVEVFRYRRA